MIYKLRIVIGLILISILLLISGGAYAMDIVYTNFSDDTLGEYHWKKDRVYIQRGLSPAMHEYVMDHEKAHRHWYYGKTEIQRRLYCRRFERGQTPTPTEYSKTSCEENYAERIAQALLKERELLTNNK